PWLRVFRSRSVADLKKLFDDGAFDRVIAIVNASASPSVDDIAWRAESYCMKKEWAAAIDDFVAVTLAGSTKTKPGLFNRARAAMRRLNLNKEETEAAWRRFSDPVSLEMEAISEKARQGDLDGSSRDFSAIIDRIFPDAAVA